MPITRLFPFYLIVRAQRSVHYCNRSRPRGTKSLCNFSTAGTSSHCHMWYGCKKYGHNNNKLSCMCDIKVQSCQKCRHPYFLIANVHSIQNNSGCLVWTFQKAILNLHRSKLNISNFKLYSNMHKVCVIRKLGFGNRNSYFGL